MIGNREDAALALSRPSLNLLSDDGGTREVYLINGVVYKVEREYLCSDINQREYNKIVNGPVPPGFRFPKVSLYSFGDNDVIAMEYINGTALAECYCSNWNETHLDCCMPSDMVDMLSNLHFDTGGMNVIKNDEAFYIIDAA